MQLLVVLSQTRWGRFPPRSGSDLQADLNYGGYCTQCGDEASGVEPDARQYVCESCGERAVYGIEELPISGLLQFTDDDGKD